jgi:hypothetical protein
MRSQARLTRCTAVHPAAIAARAWCSSSAGAGLVLELDLALTIAAPAGVEYILEPGTRC